MLNEARLEKATQLANRNYHVEITHDTLSDGTVMFAAVTPELPGCIAQGETPMTAVENLRDARIDYIYFLLEDGLPVPDPNPQITVSYSQISIPQTDHTNARVNGEDVQIDEQMVVV